MSTERTDFRMWHRLRVRWAEVDMQKIVFNGHFLMYFDNGMGDYWRALAFPYEAGMQQLGGDLFVKKASLEYHGSGRYDDVLDVGLRCRRIGTSSITLDGVIFRGDALLVTGELVYVYADPATQKPMPVPALLRQLVEDYEKGQTVAPVQVGSWDRLAKSICDVRDAVFVQEQGIGAHMVSDEADSDAVHAIVFNRLGGAIAAGRLLQHAPRAGRIGRMAVIRPLRGSQLGRDVLHALLKVAQERGDTEVFVHAQCSAEGFYARNGFVAQGGVFEEAGIRHITMAKKMA